MSDTRSRAMGPIQLATGVAVLHIVR